MSNLADDLNKEEMVAQVPFFVHEAAMERMSTATKRMLIALVVALIALLINNAIWIGYMYSTKNHTTIQEVSDE